MALPPDPPNLLCAPCSRALPGLADETLQVRPYLRELQVEGVGALQVQVELLRLRVSIFGGRLLERPPPPKQRGDAIEEHRPVVGLAHTATRSMGKSVYTAGGPEMGAADSAPHAVRIVSQDCGSMGQGAPCRRLRRETAPPSRSVGNRGARVAPEPPQSNARKRHMADVRSDPATDGKTGMGGPSCAEKAATGADAISGLSGAGRYHANSRKAGSAFFAHRGVPTADFDRMQMVDIAGKTANFN